ncbi:MAG TPA: hypothetical protein VN708_26515 [Terriglobales bacterium]|nr:hypothetical protein [Terriglobales bacterium]
MARRNQSQPVDHFDLLPFIAILMCLLGTLLLVTMSIAAINLGPGAGEGWIPTSDTKRMTQTPVLLEWDGEQAIVHRSEKRQPIEMGTNLRTWFVRSGAFANPDMVTLSTEMEQRRSSNYLLFAVRPSGFWNFQVLASRFRSNGIPIGYEPIQQTTPVRLKMKENSP